MTLPALAGVAYAEANWGRWVCRCPSPHCRSALQLHLFEPVFRCWECGTSADVAWPPFAEDVETLLMMRPDPTTRNWLPGEDLHDLLTENAAHGVLPALREDLEAHPGGLLGIVGDRIVRNELPAMPTPLTWCAHQRTVPVNSMAGETVARLCLVCDAQLPAPAIGT